jgi:hypothetical protein
VSTGRTIEPVATVFALGIGESLPFFTLGTLTIHLTIGDVVLKDQATFCTDLGITTMVWSLTTRSRADIDGMTGIAPVLAASHFLTNRALFHKSTSINSISSIKKRAHIDSQSAPFLNNIIISR